MNTAFEREALPHKDELFATAMRYARNRGDAEDLVQETLMRAYAAWDRFQRGTNCRAWLLRILVNNYINQYRRSTRERRFGHFEETLFCPKRMRAARDPEGVLMEGQLGDEVRAAVLSLPLEYRRVIMLADLQNLSYREVAQRMNCPIGTVMSRLHRARKQLEHALEGYARERGIIRHAA